MKQQELDNVHLCSDCGSVLNMVTDGVLCRGCWSRLNSEIMKEHLNRKV